MTIRSFAVASLAALVAVLGVGIAVGGGVSAASGPMTINGKAATVPQDLKQGDTFNTQGATVTWTSASGDEVTLDPGTRGSAQGVEAEMDLLYVAEGAATGTISSKTSLGTSAGWIRVREGEGSSLVYTETSRGRADREALFRAVRGDVWIEYAGFRIWLPERHSVVLTVDPQNRKFLRFRTGQQNPSEVAIYYGVSGGDIVAFVPKASSGQIEPGDDGKTKITNDVTSLKTGVIRLETAFAGQTPQSREVGPGGIASVDNKTGAIEVVFQTVEFVILESAISLTSEFSTLAQSNFASAD